MISLTSLFFEGPFNSQLWVDIHYQFVDKLRYELQGYLEEELTFQLETELMELLTDQLADPHLFRAHVLKQLRAGWGQP